MEHGGLVLQRDISVLKHEKKMTHNLIAPANVFVMIALRNFFTYKELWKGKWRRGDLNFTRLWRAPSHPLGRVVLETHVLGRF